MKYAVGIDIGGTNTRVALINESYEIIERIQFLTDVDDPDKTMDKIVETISSFKLDIVGVGMSCPGPLDLINGKIIQTPNLHGKWTGFSVSKELEKRIQIPVYLENDANLAALAESVIGEGKAYDYVQYLTVSTGLGAGLVINKKFLLVLMALQMKLLIVV